MRGNGSASRLLYRTYMSYAMDMADETLGIADARDQLPRLVENAHFRRECTVITKNGEARAVVVPYDWYREAESRRVRMLKEKS